MTGTAPLDFDEYRGTRREFDQARTIERQRRDIERLTALLRATRSELIRLGGRPAYLEAKRMSER